MRLYLDTSALVKLVQSEPESSALIAALRQWSTDERVTSALARVELVRAVAGGGSEAVAHARRELDRLHQVNVSVDLLDEAAALAPGTPLRSLDAIHLAAALLFADSLRAVVTYDRRMAAAAELLGLPVVAPG